MKIVILSPSKKVVGGVERFSNTLREIFAASGNEVYILDAEEIKGARFFSLIGLGSVYLGWRLGQKAAKFGYDVVITNGLLGWNLKKGKIINVQHGTYAASADRIDKKRSWAKWFVKKYIWGYFEKLSSKHGIVVAVSEDTKHSIEKYYGTKVTAVIPNGVDTAVFTLKDQEDCRKILSLPSDKFIVLFVGRVEYAKGSDILLDLCERIGDVLFVVVSDKPVNKNNVRSFLNISYNDMPLFYSSADLLILPSRHEGDAYVINEAMSCGLTFITTSVGGGIELSKNKIFKSMVVNAVTSEEWLEVVSKFLKMDKQDRLNLGRLEREFSLSNRSLDMLKREYLKLLQ